MVLAQKVGKERSFGLVVLLGLVTFGIYWIYWWYKAHHEVHKQFELDREGKDQGVIWFILGLVLFQPLYYVYQYIAVKNSAYVRERMGGKPRIRPGPFLGMAIPGNILATVGIVMAAIGGAMLTTDAQPDDPDTDFDESITEDEAQKDNDVGAVLLPIGLVLAVGGLALTLVAYSKLQGTLNDIWKSFDDRLRQMGAPAQAGAPAMPPAAGQAPRTFAATPPPGGQRPGAAPSQAAPRPPAPGAPPATRTIQRPAAPGTPPRPPSSGNAPGQRKP